MFTGLIQAVAPIVAWDGVRLRVENPFGRVEPGESVAVDGCCLTVVDAGLTFELSPETVRRTCFGGRSVGDAVNLERSLRVGDRLGGHFVQGHVDTVGTCTERESAGDFERFRFDVGLSRLLIDKGSVALNGVSLTVVGPSDGVFDVWVIPETLARTNLGRLGVGERVNCEFDMLAKHLAALVDRLVTHL
jgi:riboflavin synthase